ncbi:tRNA(Thr) (cytosine(32)-N(3))-methyltransferase [Ascoidea rubescens DSM 1968]|uniref:Methyltransferase n=1 Tax=Ascoidea rubescens DSM 1968 TaxID=1344418 RepID=A0A1D2VIZ1_9ASCO|nr:methyltransferase [Ascoidea rubescens DSM 1968]ODV61540.1 methyltransferase [Ascoidea rubescens DSM 1968]
MTRESYISDCVEALSAQEPIQVIKPSLEERICGVVNQKDSRIGKDSPFTFGQRYLTDKEAIWDHNAWDHVEWGDEQIKEAELKIMKHYENPVDDCQKFLFNKTPEKFWDIFYRNNKENFFKDRKWLQIEFPLLYHTTNELYQSPISILEIGCGAGNTLFPVLRQNKNPNLRIIGVDYSKNAINLVRSSEEFNTKFADAFVWDLANENFELPETVEPNSIDIIVMIFVFSALHPDQWKFAINNLKKLIKPGGKILFRDYGKYDLAQIRFKKNRLLEDNFYIRGDGTRVYFFSEEELRNIFVKDAGFVEEKIATDRRLLVNRKKKLKMYRIWLQAVFAAPGLLQTNLEKNEKNENKNKKTSNQKVKETKEESILSKFSYNSDDDEDSDDDDGCTPPISCGCGCDHPSHSYQL